MAEIESVLTHDGTAYAATIVTIESTELGRQDHGIWHTMLHVAWDGVGTGIGGIVLRGHVQPCRVQLRRHRFTRRQARDDLRRCCSTRPRTS